MTDNYHKAGPGQSPAIRDTETGQNPAIRDKGEEVLREGRDAAQNLLQEGQAKAGEILDEQKSNLARHVKSFAEVSRNAASDLRDRDQALAADWVEAAANGAEGMANQLRDSDLNGVYNQVSDFARRQPAVFIAGAAILGFAAARFASATAARDSGMPRTAGSTKPRHATMHDTAMREDRPSPQDYTRVDYTRNNGGF